jgi:hypothetical protein
MGVPERQRSPLLADLWGLDVEVCNAILEHHARAAEGLAARIATADWIAYRIGFGSARGEPPPPPIDDPARLDPTAARVASLLATERQFFD